MTAFPPHQQPTGARNTTPAYADTPRPAERLSGALLNVQSEGDTDVTAPVPKYQIRFRRDAIYGPWRLYLPGATSPVGHFSTRERAVFVMEAHANGADCELFLRGICACRFECDR